MATVKLWTDAEAEAHPKVKAVFDDIRTTRKSDFVNNFWRGLANQPETPPDFDRVWNAVKAVMGAPGPLDPLTRELIYIAVSITNNCSYCIHSHTAAARAKGMSDAQYADFHCRRDLGLADERPGDGPAIARRRGIPRPRLNTSPSLAGGGASGRRGPTKKPARIAPRGLCRMMLRPCGAYGFALSPRSRAFSAAPRMSPSEAPELAEPYWAIASFSSATSSALMETAILRARRSNWVMRASTFSPTEKRSGR